MSTLPGRCSPADMGGAHQGERNQSQPGIQQAMRGHPRSRRYSAGAVDHDHQKRHFHVKHSLVGMLFRLRAAGNRQDLMGAEDYGSMGPR